MTVQWRHTTAGVVPQNVSFETRVFDGCRVALFGQCVCPYAMRCRELLRFRGWGARLDSIRIDTQATLRSSNKIRCIIR